MITWNCAKGIKDNANKGKLGSFAYGANILISN